jgi:hypothetical protein
MHEHRYGPTEAGTVVLSLGPGSGALILHAPASLAGAEIEISRDMAGAPRTHASVRERRARGRVSYAAVYDGLAAGGYTVWGGDGSAVAAVTVTGGRVTHHHWPASPS